MPLIWLDADTKITKKPRFTKTNFGCIKKNDNRFPFFAHCLQFDYTQESLEILSEWNDRCKKCNDQKVGDHSLLVRLLKERKTEVSHIDNFTIYGITPKRKIKSK